MSSPTDPAVLRDEPLDAEIVQSDRVYRGAVWDVRRDRFRYGDHEIVREYVAHTGAVAIVAIDEEQRVLLIQQYRHPIRQRDWEVPAGLRDHPGEDPREAAKRELAEEADLQAAQWQPLIDVYTTPGGNDELIHLFLARELSPIQTAFMREEEEADIRLEWVPLADVVDAVLAGRMRNGILATGVLAAAEVLRRES